MDEYFDVDGNQVTLPVLCMRDPGWAANRIAVMKAELNAARAENALLQLGVKLLTKLDACPECAGEKVVAACERCGHTWDVE